MKKDFVKVRVPATTANCGAGFDVLGIACSIYNTVAVRLLEEDKLAIEVEGIGREFIPRDKRNIVFGAINLLLKKVGLEKKYKGLELKLQNKIPASRGLGSSAAAIVGGLKACNAFLDNMLSEKELVALATELEGHPDNVAPAILGGMVISAMDDGVPQCLCVELPVKPKLIACVPNFHLSTKLARQALPKDVPFSDAVFNVSRTAMFVGAMLKGELVYLNNALDDRLHQPYRKKLIPGMEAVFSVAKQAGALGTVISGAGPTLMAFALPEADGEKIGNEMVEAFKKIDIQAKAEILQIEAEGAKVIFD